MFKTLRFTLVSLLMMVCGTVFAGWQKTETLTVGDVVIMAGETQSATKELTAVTTSGTTIGTATDYTGTPAGTYPLTIVAGSAEGSIAFKTTAGTYLSWSSGNSLTTAESVADASSWTVAYSNGFTVTNVGTTARILQYNASSPRFACYGNSGQTKLTFWKQVEDSPVATPTFTPNGGTFVGTTSVEIACETEGATIYYSMNGADPVAGSSPQYGRALPITETTTVKAIAVKGDDQSAVASATFTQIPSYSSFTAMNSLANNDIFAYTGKAWVIAKPTNQYVYLYNPDERDFALIYDQTGEKSVAAEKGKYITPGWTGKVSIYNQLRQLVPDNDIVVNDDPAQPVNYPAISLGNAVMNQVITLKDVTSYAVDGKNISITVNNEDKDISEAQGVYGYNKFGIEIPTFEEGKTYQIVGAIGQFNEKVQFWPIEIKEQVEPTPEPELSFYVVGSMTEWQIDEANKMTLNEELEKNGIKEFSLDMTLAADAEFKVASSTDGSTIKSWFPEGIGNSYVVAEAGDYTIYCRPNLDGDENWHESCLKAVKKAAPEPAQSWTAPTIAGETPVSGNNYKVLNVGSGKFLAMGKAWFSWSTTAIVADEGFNATFIGDAASFTLTNTSNSKFVFTSGNDIKGDAMHADGANATQYGLTKLDNGYYHIHDAGGNADSPCWGYNSSFHATGIVAHANAVEGWNCEWIFMAPETDSNIIKAYAAKKALYDALVFAKENGIDTDEASLVYTNAESTVDDIKAAAAKLNHETYLAINTKTVEGASAENGVVTKFVVNGTFDSNTSGWTCTGGFQNQALASNQNGAFTVPFFENWNGSAKANKMYQTIENVPNGTYKLNIAAFVNTLADPNESQYVFANNDKKYLTAGEPTAYEVWTVVTDNTIEVGLEQTTATANWMGIDNVVLTYYGEGDVIEAAKAGSVLADYEAANGKPMEATLAEALTGAKNTYDADKSDENLAALKTAVEAATASVKAYENAKNALEGAAALLATTNVYTADALAAFNAIYDQNKYNEGTLTTAEASAMQNPVLLTGWQHDNAMVADDLLLSAWTINDVQAKDFDTALYINTWSKEGETDGTEFKVPFFEYWTGDANSLGENKITATLTGLEEGRYEVEAWIRVHAKSGAAAKEATGITANVNDGEAVDVTEGPVVEGTQFSLAKFTATGLVGNDGILKFNLNIAADNNISWLSFKNVNYKQTANSTDLAYERANETMVSGETYLVSTVKDETTYYLKKDGYLTANLNEAGLFEITARKGGNFKEQGWFIPQFTNGGDGSNNFGAEAQKHLIVGNQNRADFETQVLFLNTEGKYAIRSTNANSSQWGAGAFWTVVDDNDEDGLPNATYVMNEIPYVWDITSLASDSRYVAYGKTQAWPSKTVFEWTSNAKEGSEGSYEALSDRTYTTYFHSAYNNAPDADHYLQAELPAATDNIFFYYKKRSQNNNNRPTTIEISASKDGSEFVPVTTISEGLPTDAAVLDYTSDKIELGDAYNFVRFTVTATNNGAKANNHVFFTFSEFYVLNEALSNYWNIADWTALSADDVDAINNLDADLEAAYQARKNAADIAALKAQILEVTTAGNKFSQAQNEENIFAPEDIETNLAAITTLEQAETGLATVKGMVVEYVGKLELTEDVDVTNLFIVNPTPIAKGANAGWEGDGAGNASNGVAEYWNQAAAGFYQTITLPAGDYKLTVVALQRENRKGFVYAGDNQTAIVGVNSDTANGRDTAAAWFAAGNGKNEVNFTMEETGNIKIGLQADGSTADYWTVWQSFKLEKLAPKATTYAINFAADIANGSIEAKIDGAVVTEAEAGATVTLVATPAEGYELDALTVLGGNGNVIEVSEGNTFEMPAFAVMVNATFKAVEEEEPVIAATLVHTASSSCGGDADVYTSTVDAETEHVNNSAFNATWQGAAYAEFDFASLPKNATVTKATFTFTGIGESRKARDCGVFVVNADEVLDYAAMAEGNAKVNLAATNITTVSFPQSASETFNIDVLDQVKALAAAGQKYVIFKMTGNSGGGDVAGKASENAPKLVIEYAPGAPEIANASFEADGEKAASNGALELTGWTFAGVGTQFNNTELRPAGSASTTSQFGTSDPSDGEYSLFFRQGWNDKGNVFTITSDALAKMPAGDYILSVDYKQHYSYDKDNQANQNTKVGIALMDGEVALVSEKSPAASGTKGGDVNTYFNDAEWSTLEAPFTIEKAVTGAKIVISLNSYGARRSDFFIDNVQLTLVPGIDVAKIELQKAIEAAQAELAKYTVGDGLFMYPESEVAPLTRAIATAQGAYNAEDATKESIETATATLNAAVETFAPAITAPAADKAYAITNVTAPGKLCIANSKITIADDAAVYFTAVEGGFVLSNVEGEYVAMTSGSTWSMTTTTDIATAYVLTVLPVEGGYTLNGSNGIMGLDYGVKAPDNEDKTVYANKSIAYNGVWTIAEYVAPTTYAINIEEAENGKVESDKATAAEGETVTLTATPDEGYIPNDITITYGEDNKEIVPEINEETLTATFVMPAGDVTIVMTFKVESGTGINGIAADQKEVIFDMNGRRVSRTAKGVLIVNGKKVVRK